MAQLPVIYSPAVLTGRCCGQDGLFFPGGSGPPTPPGCSQAEAAQGELRRVGRPFGSWFVYANWLGAT